MTKYNVVMCLSQFINAHVDGVLTPKHVGVILYKFTVLISAHVGIQ